jgi:hypothetical protein
MKRLKINILLLIFVGLGCNQIGLHNHHKDKYSFDSEYDSLTFNKTEWSLIDSSDMENWYKREYMMKDLLENHLKLGMSKMEIVNLLGQPHAYPSTYAFRPSQSPDINGTAYKLYEDSLHSWLNRPTTTKSVLKYNRGFSGSGPNLFIIVLDKEDKAVEFLTADAI